MPFPLIPIAIVAATAAGVGLQAYDTFGKSDPITVQTYTRPKSEIKSDNTQKLLPIIALAGAAVLVLMVVLK